MKRVYLLLALSMILGLSGAIAAVLTVDMTAGGTVQVTGGIGGAVFLSPLDHGVGTGSIDPFIRIQMNGNNQTGQQGFNSGSGAAPTINLLNDKDQTNTQFNHDLTKSQLNTFTLTGAYAGTYYRFLLDANEPDSAGGTMISLDELKIFTSPTASLTAFTLGGDGGVDGITGATLRYDLQTATACGTATAPGTCSSPQTDHNVILQDSSISAGSGNGYDMVFYVPTSLFSSVASSDYLYLYSRYGMLATGTGILNQDWRTDSGFEEWARDLTASEIPEPKFVLGMAFGAVLLFVIDYRRRRQNKVA
jgi:hypothetical protein